MYRCQVGVAFIVMISACGGSSSPNTHGDATIGDGPADSSVPASGWSNAAIATAHACGVQGNGGLYCWGSNLFGELGVGSRTEADAPIRIGTAGWKAVSVEAQNTCGIQIDGSLWCWGFVDGELGFQQPSGVTIVDTPTEVGGRWSSVAVAHLYGCGIKTDRTLWCWGTVPTVPPFSIVPAQLYGGSWSAVATGDNHACGIQSDGSLWCWGYDDKGALGDGQMASQEPVHVGAETWRQVAVGIDSTCGITSNGHLRCWGDNGYGQLAMATTTQQATVPTPVLIGGQDLDDWTSVALGDRHVCAVRSGGSLWCWGADELGQTGQPAAPFSSTPASVSGTWLSVIAEDAQTCAFAADHTLWCMGADGSAQLGDGGTSKRSPAQVPGTWSAPAMADATLCALDGSGSPRCAGQVVANGSTIATRMPDWRAFVSVAASNTPWLALSGEVETFCGIAGDRSLWCWGGRGIGVPNSGSSQTPLHVGADTWNQVSAGLHSCGIDTSNGMYCWGEDYWGETGCGTVTGAPVRVGTDATWTAVATGNYHSCGINASGTYCWGANYWAQLGDGAISSQAITCTPTAVAGSTTFVSLAAGFDHTCALDAAGHAYCWGNNTEGQVGTGGAMYVMSPTLLPNMTWLQIAGGYQFSCGVATDRSLWCWGDNSRGQLGDGTYDAHTTPVRVGTDTDWQEVEAGAQFACATKTDHSLWCWGANDHAQLGDGTGWRDQLVQVQ